VPNSNLIYAIFQNPGRRYNSGMKVVLNQKLLNWYSITINGNIYRNQINAFDVENLHPFPHSFSAEKQFLVILLLLPWRENYHQNLKTRTN